MGSIEPQTLTLPGGERIVIRTLALDDAELYLAHRHHMARTSEHNVTTPGEITEDGVQQRETIAEYLKREPDLHLVAVRETPSPDDPLLGSLTFRGFRQTVIAHVGDFGISVDEEWRGRGVGSALIRTLLEWARAHPTLEKVCLGVYENNTNAIRLYQRLGFKEEGRRAKFFKTAPGVYVDDIQMALWVKGPERV